MRTIKQRQILSPRQKLGVKSSSKSKLKISSPLNIHRPAAKTKDKIIGRQKQQDLFWVPNQSLYSFFLPLEKLGKGNLKFIMSVSNSERERKINVISNIDSFIQNYMELNEQLKVECVKWYIVSNAVNSKQTENQFNQLYSPIKFIFCSSVSSISNIILGFHGDVGSLSLKAIYDFSLNSEPFACVEEMLLENYQHIQLNCLYIMDSLKDWMIFSSKMISSVTPYFLSGQEYVSQGIIKIRLICKAQTTRLIFILFHSQISLQKLNGFRDYEVYFRSKIQNHSDLIKLNTKNTIYMKKLIQKVLIPEGKICLFHQPISRQSLINLNQVQMSFSMDIFLFDQSLYIASPSSFKMKWNSTTRSCIQFSINSIHPLKDQVKKVQSFLIQKRKILSAYSLHIEKLKKIQILYYRKGCQGDQKKYYSQRSQQYLGHCIGSTLSQCGIKVTSLDSLQYLVQTQKLTVIFGTFSFSQIQSMEIFYNVVVIPIAKQQQICTPNNQISQSYIFLDTVLRSINNLYRLPQKSPLLTYVHVLYEKQEQLLEIVECLEIPQSILKVHYIQKFQIQVQGFGVNTKHVIVSHMGIFTEDLQKKIREAQWKIKDIVVEVYLKYGQQYINRNREGGYKFIKNGELKQKIKDIQKNNEKEVQMNEKIFSENEEKDFKDSGQCNVIAEESSVELFYTANGQIDEYNFKNHICKKDSTLIDILNETLQEATKEKKENFVDSERERAKSNICAKQDQIQTKGNRLSQLNFSQNNNLIQKKFNPEIGSKFSRTPSDPFENEIVQAEHIYQDENPYKNRKNKMNYEKCNRNRENSKRNNSKSNYIKQYKQNKHQLIHLPFDFNFLDQSSSFDVKASQVYKLYIFLHRSVPHHSFTRRQHKQYHLLLYTRLEEVLIFSKYLKGEQRIVVVANDQSREIYQPLTRKYNLSEQKFKTIYLKELGENSIRLKIDQILTQVNLNINTSYTKMGSKKFSAVIVYAQEKQRVAKAIKIVKKIFGIQLKLSFLKESEFEQMMESNFHLRIQPSIRIFKVGIPTRQQQTFIGSIKQIFVLAMHPDLKSVSLDFSNLEFSLQSFFSRIIYGDHEKDYILSTKTRKGESFRKKLQGMKSDKILSYRQNSLLKTQRSQSKKSINRHSVISRSSTNLKYSSNSVVVMCSMQLKEVFYTKQYFGGEVDLIEKIMRNFSKSKMQVIVVTEKQFDTYDLFQSQYFEEVSKQIIWIVETKIQGKQVFIGKNVLFCMGENLKQIIQGVIREYQAKTQVSIIRIISEIDSIQSKDYYLTKARGKEENIKIVQILIVPNLCGLVEILQQKQRERLILTIQDSRKQYLANRKWRLSKQVVIFPSFGQISTFIQNLGQKVDLLREGKTLNNDLLVNIGSCVLIPDHHYFKLGKSKELGQKKGVSIRRYNRESWLSIIGFNILRTVILTDSETNVQNLRKCQYSMQIQKNAEKSLKKLCAILL